jgi:RNase adapter protein RapZ
MTMFVGGPGFVILSGLSGAGKTQALDAFEDAGYFCIDNLPPQLVPTLVDLLRREGSKVERMAVVCDARGGEYFGQLGAMLEELRERDVDYRLVFLEASNDALVRRFKETRRRHPLAAEGSVIDGIRAERRLLAGLRERAQVIIDTGDLSLQQLRSRLNEQVIGEERRATIVFAFVSFGYKYGIPIDADLLFDVRFLANPYWDLDLRPLTGREPRVRDFVLASEGADEYFARLFPLLDFLFPRYAAEGKAHLTVGIGCTGGKHRSVAIAEHLSQHYRESGFYSIVRHRDIARD